ncbi:ABC transporter substrate-binding protein [Halobacterium wangiae]|uniref:ABC transporter substrate-binding protein n=1 Tax=Halobacterium wangiae TaxID=2902623 RepID=UPI001E5B2B2C|nr:ABC transporter substrate-binding protein [Halobacterium wangiae]
MRRRRFIKTTGAATVAGLLAGCASPVEGGDGNNSESDSYTVSMTPVGEVTFDGVPETAAVYMPGYADMAVALGHGDAVASVGQKGRFNTNYYDELDGVDVDESGMVDLVESGVTRETLLSLDADVHLIDPNWLLNVFDSVDQDDVDVLEERNGPFFGNTIFRRTDEWHDYDYYTLYGAFEKVSEVFRETERFEAFQSFHDDFVAGLDADLPSEGPRAALVWGGEDEPSSFSPYHLSGQGSNKKPFHDLGVRDALKEAGVGALSTGNRSKVDYETLLDVDPEVLFVRGHEDKTSDEFEDTVVSFMQDHDTASRITAVENGDVFRGGPIYLGPIEHLFVTERFATDLYPDSFEGDLFDRDELASIVTS